MSQMKVTNQSQAVENNSQADPEVVVLLFVRHSQCL